jgi:hypothetical protein
MSYLSARFRIEIDSPLAFESFQGIFPVKMDVSFELA